MTGVLILPASSSVRHQIAPKALVEGIQSDPQKGLSRMKPGKYNIYYQNMGFLDLRGFPFLPLQPLQSQVVPFLFH